MPQKEWTTEADFLTWTETDANAGRIDATGFITIEDGYDEAVFRSPVYESASWVRNQHVEMDVNIPVGANVLLRFRSDDEVFLYDAVTPDWSDYYDGQAVDGTVQFNLDAYYRNNPLASVGAFVQYEVTLTRG